MKKFLIIALALLLSLFMTACGKSAVSDHQKENSSVTMDWHEIGEGPSGWVIGITVNNSTPENFVQDALVTITDSDGTILGEDTIHIELSPNDSHNYPVHCKKGNSYNVDIKKADADIGDIAASADIKEFPINVDETISNLNESLEGVGIVLENPIVTSGDSTELGKHTAYTYSLGKGASLCIYVSDNTENILNFTVLTVASEIDGDALNKAGYVIGCLEGGLAGEEASRVDAELNMQDLSEDTFATSSTDSADFLYMVQDGSLVFMVTPA